MDVEQIARVCHETNRTYCGTLGDFTQLPWDTAPKWQRDSAIKGVKFHLDAHDKGETPSPSASHDEWLKEKQDTGWTYGPVKDEAKKQHPCCVPYEELPSEQKLKDYLFGAIVASFVRASSATPAGQSTR